MPMKTINGSISDLFFNLEKEDCLNEPVTKTERQDGYAGYDRTKLLAKADWFIMALASAGTVLPWSVTPEALVADFEKRL